ncbi:MAG: NRDE family protein [Myxococcota bacterium]
MCTIIALHHVHPRYPLVIAANRDELYARPASGPQVLVSAPRVVGGKDLERGGTWMGLSTTPFFVGLTNQRTYQREERPKSRGAIPLEALRRGSMEGARALLEEIDPREYREFNLIYGDGRSLEVAYVRETGVERVALSAGVHVLANDRMGSPHFPKEQRARDLVAVDVEPLALRSVLRDRTLPPLDTFPDPPAGTFSKAFIRELQALCIHTLNYGTRSATILWFEPDPLRVGGYLFADGPPDETEFEDHTELLR